MSSLLDGLPSLGVSPGPRTAEPLPGDRPVRWGFLATGKIAHSMAQDLALVPEATLAAVASRRTESAEAFAGAGREELAAQERAEGEVLARYLPQQLTDDELAAIARTAVEETAADLGERPGPRQMGQVMKRANAAAAGRADGGRVAAAVKALLVG